MLLWKTSPTPKSNLQGTPTCPCSLSLISCLVALRAPFKIINSTSQRSLNKCPLSLCCERSTVEDTGCSRKYETHAQWICNMWRKEGTENFRAWWALANRVQVQGMLTEEGNLGMFLWSLSLRQFHVSRNWRTRRSQPGRVWRASP